jgi:hypothetical protein
VRTGDAAEYVRARTLFIEALAAVHADDRVPACPAWTVHELLAHQVHQLTGACDGTFPLSDAIAALGASTDDERATALRRQQAWIDVGVGSLRARDIPRLVDQWADLTDTAPAIALDGLLPDLAVHLFDLLGVAGNRSHRAEPLVFAALRFWAAQADVRVRLAGQGGLRLVVHDGPSIGEADAEVSVSGTAFELLRAVTGRRSRHQCRDGVDALAVYGWRDTPLDE